MRRLVWAILAMVTAFASVGAQATDADAFRGVLKKYGVSDDAWTSRKVCLCSGGTLDRYVGVLVAGLNNNYFTYDCALPSFDSNGQGTGSASCVNSGGTALPLGK